MPSKQGKVVPLVADVSFKTHQNVPEKDIKCLVGGVNAFTLLVSSIIGVAPLKFVRVRGAGWLISISTIKCYYSYAIGTILIGFSFYGLYTEYNLGYEKSVKMSSRTSQIASTADILSVVLTATVSVYGSKDRMKRLMKIMQKIMQIDTELVVERSQSMELIYLVIVVVALTGLTILLVDDFIMYTVQAHQKGNEWEMDHLISFYLLYYIVGCIEIQFVFICESITKRMKALNDALIEASQQFNNTEYLDYKTNDVKQPMNSKIGHIIDSFAVKSTLFEKSFSGVKRLIVPPCELIRRISDLQATLCSSIIEIELIYGPPLLTVLIAIFMQLTVTPYFMLQHSLIVTSADLHITILESFWILTHFLRLVFTIEPCYRILKEGRRSMEIVSNLLGSIPHSGSLRESVQTFSGQLLMRTFTISPLGICTLNRSLIATITGAVTTYLVILLQFND